MRSCTSSGAASSPTSARTSRKAASRARAALYVGRLLGNLLKVKDYEDVALKGRRGQGADPDIIRLIEKEIGLTGTMAKHSKYFLPYQGRWLADTSRIRSGRNRAASVRPTSKPTRTCATARQVRAQGLVLLGRRIGRREYIEYCEKWSKLFHLAAENLGLVLLDSEKDIKTFTIQFANGTKIHALSSNPKAFRSKGGKVVWDEAAWHDDQDKMWAAARPTITWGFPLRILSTHNGKSCRFYRFVEAVKKGKLPWSLHTTPIKLAVAEGLADRIVGRDLTEGERTAWLETERESVGDEDTWLQEYRCIPVDEAAAFLTYELLASRSVAGIIRPLSETTGDLYVGVDIGRKKDLTVIWVLERCGPVLVTRLVKIMERTPFHMQRQALFAILGHRAMRRACIDATGLGMQLAEESQRAFGQYRVEAVTFSGAVKESLAYPLRAALEDARLILPDDHEIREDLHSVRKVTTARQHPLRRGRHRSRGHADRFGPPRLPGMRPATTVRRPDGRGGGLARPRESPNCSIAISARLRRANAWGRISGQARS
jgi:phage FluMu gp28-like protein